MVQISATPLYQLFAHLLLVAPILTFVAMLAATLPSQLARRVARKMVPAPASAVNRNRCAAGLRSRSRRNF
jgi:hypothetical protein